MIEVVGSRSARMRWPALAGLLLASACHVRAPVTAGPSGGDASEALPPSAFPPEPTAAPNRSPRNARVLESILAEPGSPPTVHVVIDDPRFPPGTGPRLGIDEGHHDFHTLDGMFAPFADAARADGFRVIAHEAPFSAESLAALDILVIANALHERNDHRIGGEWTLPTPSAFTDDEIAALDAWIVAGGRLWLIADHMPFPGAAQALATRLGFGMSNGFAFAATEQGEVIPNSIQHTRDEGTIVSGHPITEGRGPSERADSVRSFTGQAFEVPDDAVVVLRMPSPAVSLVPATAWQFDEHTPRHDVSGWPVMAAREHGRGRIVVSGEAAMLSARYVEDQRGEWQPVGFQAAEAHDNLVLVLNTLRWLAG
ncbi:hypothetical protein OEB96_44885 [Paraliomyxa miuraensis]|nr:hypothetical protein [Paraliomyxa miuraensis]